MSTETRLELNKFQINQIETDRVEILPEYKNYDFLITY